jgi:predicted ATPase/pimeloyl-ACP methyl ester carboxylesterase
VIFEFEGFELDTDRFELRTGGEASHVEPQVFDVLRYLVEHRDRVVPKEELLDNVWGDRFVSESALTSRIKAARQAVGDSGRRQRVIGTSHGRGYRFIAPVVVRETADTAATPREVRYTRSGDVNVAYQVTGEGPIDIVLVPGFVSHLEYDWEDPRSAAFLDRLGSMGRLIRFDKRGTGLSDRPAGLPDLETRMDDVRAVMDAAGSERAVVFGYSEGGPMAALFAATYPERTHALALYGTYAKRIRTDDYPWAPTAKERAEYAATIEAEWGFASDLELMCPSADAAMSEWFQRRARAAASPGAARALIEMNSRIDIRDVLPSIHVPTLVLHRVGDLDSRSDEGRYIAARIPGAQFIELEGADHSPWINADQILDPIAEFVTAATSEPRVAIDATDRALATTLFTDIVGSTELNASMGDARWSALLDRHDHITRTIVEQWRGRWVKSTGDGALAVFDGPARALRAADGIRAQLAELGLQIRVGVHASEIERRGDDVTGLGVTIAARLMAIAEPDEVLTTGVVRDLIAGSGLELSERGVETLKGVPGDFQICALLPASTPRAVKATPPAIIPPLSGNVPVPNDPIIGRTEELARLGMMMSDARVVTLAGPGGVGKTRLAIEYAHTRGGDCWFVDLSRVAEPDAVACAFLDTFGASRRSGTPDVERLVETLELRPMLLVVDNCEQVLEAVADVVTYLARDTFEVSVLATSRQPLGLDGEQVLVVAPLALPDEFATGSEQQTDAIRMFTERAERTGAHLDDWASVIELCRRLDGIPLALELAAARTRAFSPAQILEQLDAGWSVSVPRRTHGPAHHLSLDETIDWSFRLLDDAEQALLLALQIFSGPFDLHAAAAVAGEDVMTTADLLTQLVEKSLVQSVNLAAGRRFRLLETVRAFAYARVDPAVDTLVSARHAAHFASEVEELGGRIPGLEEDDALARLGVVFDDVHTAFVYALTVGDVDTMARLACGPRLSVSSTGARWAHLARQAVRMPGIEKQPEYLDLLAGAAWGAVLVADLDEATELCTTGVAIVGDAAAHPRLCWISPQATRSSFSEGAATCVRGAAVAHTNGDVAAEAFLLGTAAIYGLAAGNDHEAVEAAEQARVLAHQVGSRSLWARAAGALAYALQDLDATAARVAAEECLSVADAGDFHRNMPLRVLGVLAWRAGRNEEAASYAAQAAALIRDQGDRYVQGASMRQLAALVGEFDPIRAAELLGIALALVPEIRVIKRDEVADAALQQRLREELGEETLEATIARGRNMDIRTIYTTVEQALNSIRTARRD